MLNFWRARSEASEAEAARAPVGGLVAGTQVATEAGWVPVERIKVGDRVLTFDGGLQVVTGLTRRRYPYGTDRDLEAARPLIHVPEGLLGNARALPMLPDQPVLVESDLAERVLGDPFAPVRAEVLTDLPGVAAVLPEDNVIAVTLAFETDQVIFAEGQVLILCPSAPVLAPATLEDALFGGETQRYRVLEGGEARLFAEAMVMHAEASRSPAYAA